MTKHLPTLSEEGIVLGNSKPIAVGDAVVILGYPDGWTRVSPDKEIRGKVLEITEREVFHGTLGKNVTFRVAEVQHTGTGISYIWVRDLEKIQ